MPNDALDQPKSRKVTLWMDGALTELGKKFVRANRSEKSLSNLIERLLIRHMGPKLRKYKMRMPSHLN